MARQNLNIIEQHVEKLTVGAVALLFLWVIYAFLLGSPNRISLSNEMAPPDEVDQRVRATAENMLGKFRNSVAQAAEVPKYPEEQSRNAPGPLRQDGAALASTLRPSVSFGPPVPQVAAPGEPGRVTIAQLAAPDQPIAVAGKLSALFFPHSVPVGGDLSDKESELLEFEGSKDRSWVTVAVRLDLAKQKKILMDNQYQINRFKITPAELVLHRQQRQDGGEWGPWEEVQKFSDYHLPPPPKLSLVEEGPNIKVVPVEQRQALRDWFAGLRDNQFDLIRPRLPEPAFGPSWQPPLLKELMALYPEEAEEWQFFEPAPEIPQGGRRLPPIKQAKDDLDKSKQFMSEGRLEDALDLVDGILKNNKIPIRHRIKKEADALRVEIERKLYEKEKEEIVKGGEAEPDDSTEEIERTAEILLAHDLSGKPGAVYRYRAKVLAFNQYATIVDRLKNSEDATKVFIESEWSPESEPVVVPPLQLLHLASAKEDTGRFDILQWVKGQWVDAVLTAKIGEYIRGTKKIVHRDEGRIDIDFDTRSVLVDISNDRTYIPRKKQKDGTIVLGEPELSDAALCRRDDGEVFELVVSEGKNDEEWELILIEMEAMKKATRPRRPGTTTPPGTAPPGGRGGRGGGGG